MAGLRSPSSQKVILIAGGYDKHIPYDVLGPELVAHVKAMVLTGATAPKIQAAVRAGTWLRPCRRCPSTPYDDFADAVHKAAYELAQPGDVVILSPGLRQL